MSQGTAYALKQIRSVLCSTFFLTAKMDVTEKGVSLEWPLSLLHLITHPRNFHSHPGNCELCISSQGTTLPLETR